MWHHDSECFSASLVLCHGNPPISVGSSLGINNEDVWCFICVLSEQIAKHTVQLSWFEKYDFPHKMLLFQCFSDVISFHHLITFCLKIYNIMLCCISGVAVAIWNTSLVNFWISSVTVEHIWLRNVTLNVLWVHKYIFSDFVRFNVFKCILHQLDKLMFKLSSSFFGMSPCVNEVIIYSF